ncbi:hypothetical protein D3C86_1470890 [compost metagenome]
MHWRVMVPASNAQDSPQHGGRHRQPAGNQHHYGHCQAHQCLLFAPAVGAHSLANDSLAAAVFQTIDQRSAVINEFVLSNAINCRSRLYRCRLASYDRWPSRERVRLAPEQVSDDGAGIFSNSFCGGAGWQCRGSGGVCGKRCAGNPAAAGAGRAQRYLLPRAGQSKRAPGPGQPVVPAGHRDHPGAARQAPAIAGCRSPFAAEHAEPRPRIRHGGLSPGRQPACAAGPGRGRKSGDGAVH